MMFVEGACEERSRSEALNVSLPVPDGSKEALILKNFQRLLASLTIVSDQEKSGEGVI